jgi:hypothetical protein
MAKKEKKQSKKGDDLPLLSGMMKKNHSWIEQHLR